jgi:hypothetical protein
MNLTATKRIAQRIPRTAIETLPSWIDEASLLHRILGGFGRFAACNLQAMRGGGGI